VTYIRRGAKLGKVMAGVPAESCRIMIIPGRANISTPVEAPDWERGLRPCASSSLTWTQEQRRRLLVRERH
jgi:hypothetical protein